MQAFSYLRVSGKRQVAGDGFPRPREKVEQCAESTNGRIARNLIVSEILLRQLHEWAGTA